MCNFQAWSKTSHLKFIIPTQAENIEENRVIMWKEPGSVKDCLVQSVCASAHEPVMWARKPEIFFLHQSRWRLGALVTKVAYPLSLSSQSKRVAVFGDLFLLSGPSADLISTDSSVCKPCSVCPLKRGQLRTPLGGEMKLQLQIRLRGSPSPGSLWTEVLGGRQKHWACYSQSQIAESWPHF
jgi:hypothetical protein